MRIAVKDAPVVVPRAGLREVDGRAPLLMIAPVLPAEYGNGLAMRAGLFLDALSQDFAVNLLVVPLFGPVDREAVPIFVVERVVQWAVLPISPESEPLYALYSRIKDPVRRAAALTDYPRPALARFATGQALERVAALWRDTSFSAVHVMRLYLAPFAAPWIGGGGPRPRCILDLDDIEHRTRRRLAALHRRNGNALAGRIEEAEAGKYRTLAEGLCPRFDTVLVCSEEDAGALRRDVPGVPVAVAPNAVRIPRTTARPSKSRSNSMLLVGSFGHFPNVDAALHFSREILPLVERRLGRHANLSIVGGNPPPDVRALADRRGIAVFGDVEDLRPHYASCDIVVVPIRTGGGTRIKVLEACAYRRAVVATSIGAEGIARSDAPNAHAPEMMIADAPERFADCCARLLNDPGLRNRVAEAGFGRIRSTYEWSKVAAGIRALYASDGADSRGPAEIGD